MPTVTPTPTPTPTPLPAVRIASGDHAIFNGDWEQAIQDYQDAHAASSDPEIQAASLLGLGRAYLYAHNDYQAVETLKQLVDTYPDSPHLPHAYFSLGQAYHVQQKYSDAAQAYLNYLALRPGVIDAYVLDLRGDALFAAGDYAGAANDFNAALQSPSMLDGIFVQMKMARSYALSNDSPTALSIYDDISYRTSNENTQALIQLRKGQIYTSLGQVEQANAAYLQAVQGYPTTYEAYSALVALVDAGVVVDELNRGIVDYYAGEYGLAMAALDRYLQGSPTDPGTARYYYGLALRAAGGNEEAVQQWERLIQDFPDHRYWDDAWEQKAYTQWAYLDQYPQAVQTLLDFVDKVSAHSRAAEFLFDAAQVAERDGNLQQAAELWKRVADEYPSDERSSRALFLSGIAQYRRQDHTEAMHTFQRYLSIAVTLEERAAANLWTGKAQYALGDQEAARSSWGTAASIDPTGYYSERARELLQARQPFTPPLGFDLSFDIEVERSKAEAWMKTTFGLPESENLAEIGSLANDPQLVRGTELWRLGLYAEARAEFEALRESLVSDPAQSYRLTNYLYELGLYRSAILAARQVLSLALMSDADTMSAPAYFNHVRFGTYYSDLILPGAQEYGFHPLFLFSLIRQESLFESFVRSSAAASGLMQIIPDTGQEIATFLGWPADYTNADLNRPKVSLNFGVYYLDKQRSTFEGDLYAALAAYNGGPGNAAEWHRLAPDDPDLFLEIIRYEETRNYIRSIYEIFNIYRLIYNRTP